MHAGTSVCDGIGWGCNGWRAGGCECEGEQLAGWASYRATAARPALRAGRAARESMVSGQGAIEMERRWQRPAGPRSTACCLREELLLARGCKSCTCFTH